MNGIAASGRVKAATPASRIRGETRRERLLDAAAEMVAGGRTAEVSMESVAEQAGVSRALLYKHFPNRHALLGALYERESARLHAELSSEVVAASSLEEMLRALVRGAITAQARRGATFEALRASGGRTSIAQETQRVRDSQTLSYFTRQAMREFGVGKERARTHVALGLGSIQTVLERWRERPTEAHAHLLEDALANLVIGGLSRDVEAKATSFSRPADLDASVEEVAKAPGA